MQKTISTTLIALLTTQLSTAITDNKDKLPQELQGDYTPASYTWTSPSKNSSESMPVGGHDIGLNVWVENGDLLIYMCQSGWFDENNTLLKAGRLRLHLDGDPFNSDNFNQTLSLDNGSMSISTSAIETTIWVDAYQPTIYISIDAKKSQQTTLSYESWRQKDRQVPADASQQNSWKWLITPDVTTYADSIIPATHSLTFSHKNRSVTVFDKTVEIESLSPIKDQLYNPIGNREMKGTISTPDLSFSGTTDGTYVNTDFRAYQFSGKTKSTTITVRLTTSDHTASYPTISAKESKKRTAKWWHAFWQRSYITLPDRSGEPDPADSAAVIVRNYELFRYMLGCNASGKWPTKFNGGLFTFDPVFVDEPRQFTPDYRCWGGGTMTAQNQRLIYWPMIKSADEDMLLVQLDTYLRMLQNARLRTKFYWGHGGASFTEQIENCGLPNPAEYGEHAEGQDLGVESNAWLEYIWDTSLEFCQMALDAHAFLATDISKYEEMILECLRFFDEHYQWQAKRLGKEALTEDGKLTLFPGSGAETYKMAYNASSTIAALQTVTENMLSYASAKADSANANYLKGLKYRIPDIPLRTIEGDTVIAPAIVWARIQNVETPQMYPVFPWRIFGLGRDHLDWAVNTWNKDPWALKMRSERGWKQDNIWAACIGDTEEAARLNYDKMKNGPYRFPAFYDMGFDWAPDFNRGGSGMIGIQEMLMQRNPDGSRIEKPAWPKRWGEVKYKLK